MIKNWDKLIKTRKKFILFLYKKVRQNSHNIFNLNMLCAYNCL